MTASEHERVLRAAAASAGVAAGLLGSVAFLAWRVERRAREVETALDAVRQRTDVVFDIPKANAALERMTTDLHELRTGGRE